MKEREESRHVSLLRARREQPRRREENPVDASECGQSHKYWDQPAPRAEETVAEYLEWEKSYI